ncbi:UNVERIFIED_CONTAM: hypothetical protein PYX00_007599 [Menopon gallinae]|uniref:Uncharacterized protein n=1 Tax=Menopon gallinae TaxID=328185 RepID=A0AAW2HKD7_9NEOP
MEFIPRVTRYYLTVNQFDSCGLYCKLSKNNVAYMNACLTNKMNLRSYDKLNAKLHQKASKKLAEHSSASGKLRNPDGLDLYKFGVRHLRDDTNALCEELITFKREKVECYENFAKENNEAIVKMINEINWAEEELLMLEKEVGDCMESKGDETLVGKDRNEKPTKSNVKTDKELLRFQESEVREGLKTMKNVVMQLKEQLNSFHNYI